MNAHERAELLCKEAEQIGLDNPTERMIAEAFCDMEFNHAGELQRMKAERDAARTEADAKEQEADALAKALEHTHSIIEAHEIDTLDCDRRGVVHCDCLSKQIARNESLLSARKGAK